MQTLDGVRVEVYGLLGAFYAELSNWNAQEQHDAKDHERVFELFRRAGVQSQPGEGIGLAHVRALVYRLGGTIEFTSELGQGSTFKLRLSMNLHEGGDQ